MTYKIGFIGTGGISRMHICALNALPTYYDEAPKLEFISVAAGKMSSSQAFAKRYGFQKAESVEELFADKEINTVFILSPNSLHYAHLIQALDCQRIKNIYMEKPLGVKAEEIPTLLNKVNERKDVNIQLGFQFLYLPAALKAYSMRKNIGKIVHFHARYLHSSYLDKSYRDNRRNRLLPAPEGGAMADLGSHVFSLLVHFLGEGLEIKYAHKAGQFEDVHEDSDLYSQVFIEDTLSGAIGTLSASRISAGATDVLELEMRGTSGAMQFSSLQPDVLKVCCNPTSGIWQEIFCGNAYAPCTTFPSAKVSSGWLRPLIHAAYVFFNENKEELIPSFQHGLTVQNLINTTAELLKR